MTSGGDFSHHAGRDVETVLILDFGSQYAQLIARRVRGGTSVSPRHASRKTS